MKFPPEVVQVDGSEAPEWINDKTCKILFWYVLHNIHLSSLYRLNGPYHILVIYWWFNSHAPPGIVSLLVKPKLNNIVQIRLIMGKLVKIQLIDWLKPVETEAWNYNFSNPTPENSLWPNPANDHLKPLHFAKWKKENPLLVSDS